jgi:hypothetical protein
MPKHPAMFSLRSPHPGSAEMVVSQDGTTSTFFLSFDQIRLLSFQSTDLVTKWPVQEIPFDSDVA